MIEQLKKRSSEVKMEESKQDKKLDVIRAGLPDDDTLYDLADLFKMFGDPTRAKILGFVFNCARPERSERGWDGEDPARADGKG